MFKKNLSKLRSDFPILHRNIIYLDSACMALKPESVINAMNRYYREFPACAGRSMHSLAQKVTEEVSVARNEVRKIINAKKSEEILFTRNTTEGLNLIAQTVDFKKGDEVLLTDKEHNSNLIPWLRLREKGIVVKFSETMKDGTLNLEQFKEFCTNKTKLVSVVHTSNLDGVTNPISDIVKIAHNVGSYVLVDGAQGVPSMPVDVRSLGVDFLAFSGHKVCGPTGTGVLYGRKNLLQALPQNLVGGETVKNSTQQGYVSEDLPMKFEAGLQDYAGIIGLGVACKYVRKIGLIKIQKHEINLNRVITDGLSRHVNILGPEDSAKRNGIFSFTIPGVDSHNIAGILNSGHNICVRSGAHCVHSWFNKHNISGSVRASVYFYNSEEEVNNFVEAVKTVKKIVS